MSRLDTRIETARLVLRIPQASDFDRYAETLGNEDAARVTWPPI